MPHLAGVVAVGGATATGVLPQGDSGTPLLRPSPGRPLPCAPPPAGETLATMPPPPSWVLHRASELEKKGEAMGGGNWWQRQHYVKNYLW
jgi:hypothetical protein